LGTRLARKTLLRFDYESSLGWRMDLLAKMSTYVRVVESGSLAAAAKQQRISAAAVSRQLSSLESELRVSLLRRTTRKLTITETGRHYYERCLRILRDVDDAQAIAKSQGVAGPLRVSAPVTFGLACVAPLLTTLLREHPALRIDLLLEDRFVDLGSEGVDMAIRVGSDPPLSTALVAQELVVFRRILVAAPAYLKKRGEPARPEALVKHDALMHAIATTDSWTLQCDIEEARVRPHVVFRSNALHVLRDLAIDGVGIALAPQWFVAPALAARKLRRVLPAWRSAPVTVHAIYRREQRGTKRTTLLIERLRAAFAAWGERATS
jgi:DNA-binding transcriptional LysR family regulator